MDYNKNETNPEVERKMWRKEFLSCSYCPPNRMENQKRKAQHPFKVHRPWKKLRGDQFKV